MAIYDLGTASLAATGEVTGVGTTWKAPLTLIRVGATIIFKTSPLKIYTISEIISDTQINVYNPNGETVPAGTGYAILAHDGITVQGLAQDVAETLRYYQSKETSIEGLLQFIGQDTFDWPRFEKLANQSTTGAAEALASQVAAAESASTAVGASNNAQNSYKRTVAAINAAGNTAAVAYFAEHGIGSTTTPLLGSLDWQTMQFYSGGSYQCRIDNMVNIPADLSSMFPATNTTICIDVLATRGINGSNVVRVSPSTTSNAAFRVAEITFTGATGSRNFYVRELLSVPGGDAAAGGSSALRVRNLLDVYSKGEVSGSLVVSFNDGGTITSRNQSVLLFSDKTVNSYHWNGPLPKTIPRNSTPYSTGGISPTAWMPAMNGYESSVISVKNFGAVGDGVTDDTAAFQAAIDSKKSLYIPDGVYLISSTLTITATDSLCIAGNNFGHVNDRTAGSVIKFTGSASPAIRVQGGAIGVKISGLFLDIQDSSSDGFDFGGAWYLKLQDCVVRNARYGVYLHYDTPDYFSGVAELTSCYFSKCANGVKTSKVDINVVKVDNCTFFDGVNGVLIGDSGAASGVRNFIVRDSLFEANTGYDVGVVAGGAQQLLVDGNYFEENTASSSARVYVTDSALSPRSSSVSITNNTFSKDTTGDLVFLSGISGVLVKQNWSAFGGVGFVRAINIDNYEIDRCSTVSGAEPCNVVIDNVSQAPDTSVNKIYINKAQEYAFVGNTAVKRSSACTRAMIQFNGISGGVVYADGATVSKTGTGKYTINLSNALPSSAYAVSCSVGNTTNGGKLGINVVSTSVGSFNLEVFDLSGAHQDSGYISAVVVM